MFTPESAIGDFRNILDRASIALMRETAYAINQMTRMQDAIISVDPIEFNRAEAEYSMAVKDCKIYLSAAKLAIVFLTDSREGLSDGERESALDVGEAEQDLQAIAELIASLIMS